MLASRAKKTRLWKEMNGEPSHGCNRIALFEAECSHQVAREFSVARMK